MTNHDFEELKEFISGCEESFLSGNLEPRLEETCNRMANLLYGTTGKCGYHGRRNGSKKSKNLISVKKNKNNE